MKDRDKLRQDFANKVEIEREKQNNTWGHPDLRQTAPWLAILVEEVGEVARAFLDNEGDTKRGDLVTELVQVAAVASAWAESLRAWALSADNAAGLSGRIERALLGGGE